MEYSEIILFFWRHIYPYKWHYAVMLVSTIVACFYPFACNYSIKLFLDYMSSDDKVSFYIITYPIYLFILSQIFLEAFSRLSDFAQWRSEPFVRKSIIQNVFSLVSAKPMAFFNENLNGVMASKISGILSGYDALWEAIHRGLLTRIFKTFINIMALSIVNSYLTIFVCMWCIFYTIIVYKKSIILQYIAFQENEEKHSIIGNISDKFENMMTVLCCSNIDKEIKNLQHQLQNRFIPAQQKTSRENFRLQLTGGILHILLVGSIMGLTIHLKVRGLVSVGDLAFVLMLSLLIAEDIWQITTGFQGFMNALGDLKSSTSIIYPQKIYLSGHSLQKLKVREPKIEFRNLSFTYDETNALLKNVNFTLESGDSLGILGYSGAGKTTLFKLMLGFYKAQNGEILIDGQKLSSFTPESIRHNVSLVSKEMNLFNKSIFDNVTYGSDRTKFEQVVDACKRAYAHDFILKLPGQYNYIVGEKASNLSAGQVQRLILARAILKDAPILLLDEPTSSLDVYSEKMINDCIKEIIKRKNKTVICISHRFSTVEYMDKTLLLDEGTLKDMEELEFPTKFGS